MKKILLFTATILAVCMGTSAFAAEHSNETDIELLSAMSIMQGDGNGFDGERILTREQLAKISVSVTEPYFTSKSRISPYSDVSYTKWSAPYIERASEKGYFSGYPDGSFHPEDAVSAEELCRVMLNFLGYDYTASAAGGWADAQLAAAEELGLPDGTSNEYVSDKDYSGYECKAVKITFKDGKAHLTVLGTNKSVSGTYNRERGTLGEYTVADDVEIIDTAKNTYNKNTRGIGKKIFPQRLDGTSLTSDNILYASVTDNRITQLILNDCTGDIYSYGIVLKAENSSSDYSVSGSYEININGEIKSFSTSDSAFSVHKGDVIRCIEEDGTPIIMQPIGQYSERAAAVDNLYAYIGSGKYRLSDDVVVYRKIADTESAVERRYEVISEDQLSSDDKLTAYYDKSEASGGRIRVIVAE